MEFPKNRKTEILYDIENSLQQGVRFMQNAKKIDIAGDKSGPSVFIENDIYKINLIEARERGAKLRYITDITKDNLHYCKEMSCIANEMRHFEGFSGGLAVSDSEYMGTTVLREKQHSIFLIYSNEMELVEQQQIIFNTLWEKAIPANQRILEIEEGIVPEYIQTISNDIDILNKTFGLLQSANEEILIVFSTSNAFHRIINDGYFQKLKEIKDNKPWLAIRVLTPKDAEIEKIASEFNNRFKCGIRFIEPLSKVVILIADRKFSLVAETKDDTKQTVTEAMGLVTYSNSVPTVLSYAAIFDSLWKQTEIYDQLKKAHERLLTQDKIQKEFISNAAHELRTPIQPILGISEILRNSVQNTKDNELLGVISRNAQRLKKLSEDILEVSKIESDAMNLNKEQFKVNDEIADIIKHYKNNVDNKNIQFEYAPHDNDLTVLADRNGIGRVISNLISNSIKFIPQGAGGVITINAGKDKTADSNDGGKEKVVVIVKDTGIGIDEKIFPKLFTKFSTKSFHGMGLGLYISKNIVEAHGGRMWAKNNEDGKGATFSFSLPLKKE
jgi:two-component system, OmpR family, sensor histidine kinase VicK